MIAVYFCVFALVADLFDKFERRYAKDLMGNFALLPRCRCAWGIWTVGGRLGRYFMLRLPSYSWEYEYARMDFGMAQAALLYFTGQGWRLVYLHE